MKCKEGKKRHPNSPFDVGSRASKDHSGQVIFRLLFWPLFDTHEGYSSSRLAVQLRSIIVCVSSLCARGGKASELDIVACIAAAYSAKASCIFWLIRGRCIPFHFSRSPASLFQCGMTKRAHTSVTCSSVRAPTAHLPDLSQTLCRHSRTYSPKLLPQSQPKRCCHDLGHRAS